MKVVLCAIAKNENNYIREWVKYHLKLGFDQIYLYDNNDINGEHFEDVIADYINDERVIVLDIRGERKAQIKAYNDFYNTYAKLYDWVAFWDIDEFLVLDSNSSIQDFISEQRFKEFNCIAINWCYFDDNNLIEVENSNYNVLDRFKIPSNNPQKQNKFCKRIVKTNVKGININSSHGPITKTCTYEELLWNTVINNKVKACNVEGKPLINNDCDIINSSQKYARLNHYRFKTLSEYVNNKMKRGYATLFKNEGKELSIYDFFKLNDITEEKLKWLRNNNIEYDINKLKEIEKRKNKTTKERKKFFNGK